MKILEILEKSKNLILDKKNWTRITFARDKDNRSVSPVNPEAVCFCALGALSKICDCKNVIESNESISCGGREAYYYLCMAANKIVVEGGRKFDGSNPVSWVNDVLHHQDVLDMYDSAIELAKKGDIGY